MRLGLIYKFYEPIFEAKSDAAFVRVYKAIGKRDACRWYISITIDP